MAKRSLMQVVIIRRSFIYILIVSILAFYGSEAAQKYAAMSDAKSAVRHLLKDPSSAEFEDLKFFPSFLGFNSVCGKVNARNSLGGYVGARRFIWKSKDKTIDMEVGDPDTLVDKSFNVVWDYHCRL